MANVVRDRPMLAWIVLVSALASWMAASQDVLGGPDNASKFHLVGVGPGDPDLVTLRALRAIEQADLICCSGDLREKFANHLEGKQVVHASWSWFQYYGKDPAEFDGEERRRCAEIVRQRNQFIADVRRAVNQGKTVAVLDSGDPLIYGPFDWCLEEFEDLDPRVIPGLSCFNAANAALRKGITSGQHTKSVILTATDWPGKTDTIEKLSVHHATMVLFTMTEDFERFIDKLAVNYPPQTPVAVVKQAGYAEKQAVIQGTLGTILDQVGDEELPFEYLIYVGDFLTHRYKEPDSPPAQ